MLLRSRVIIQDRWPWMNFKVGDVLELGYPAKLYYGIIANKFDKVVDAEEVKKCPGIFRYLEWHEHRKLEDMPDYVKWGRIVVVAKGNYNNDHSAVYIQGIGYIRCGNLKPATLKQYKEFIRNEGI